MKKLLLLAGLIFACGHAHALNCNLASPTPAAIKAASNAAKTGSCTGSPSVLGFPATNVVYVTGTVPATTSTNLDCSVSSPQAWLLTGPPKSDETDVTIIPTALFSGPVPGSWGITISACNQNVTIANIEWNGNRPGTVSPQPSGHVVADCSCGGGGIYISIGASNITILYNYIHGNQSSSSSSSNAPLIYMDGYDTQTSGTATTTNVEVGWNQVGSITGTGNTDCSNVMLADFLDGTYYGTYGANCVGIGLHGHVANINLHNNRVWNQEQAIKEYGGSGNGPYYAFLNTNFITIANDMQWIHRNPIEYQGRGQGSVGMKLQYNDLVNIVHPALAGLLFSVPSCCGGGSVAGAPTITSPNYTTVDDNIIDSNTGANPDGIEWWSQSEANHNLIQGQIGNGINWGYSSAPPQWVANYNVFQLTSGGTAFTKEEKYTVPPTQTGNVAGTTLGSLVSSAPTVSPTPSGTYSSSISVTLTDNGYGSTTAGPTGNTSIWYTTNGATPVAGQALSSTAGYCYITCTFSVAPGTTVKALGMWGARNQPTSYPTSYGFVPSSVQAWVYPAATGTPTLTGVSLTLQDGTSTLQVGASKQACANTTYSGGQIGKVCGSGSDQYGTTPGTWASSVPGTAAISTSGNVAGAAVGSTNLTVHAGSFTSAAFPITVTAAAPVLQGVSITCTASIAVGQAGSCSCIGSYTGPTTGACPTMTYSSSAPSIATANSSTGALLGIAAGSAIITGAGGGFQSTSPLTVTTNAPPAATITSIVVSCSPAYVFVGSALQCQASANYSDGTQTNCTTTDAQGNLCSGWTSSSTGVATVSSTGLVTGVSSGNTNITVTNPAVATTAAQFVVANPSAAGVVGNNQYSTAGVTYTGSINSNYAVSPPTASTVSSCAFYLPTGYTYTAGGKYDCGLIAAPTPTTQAASWLCHETYTTLGTSADFGWHIGSLVGCGSISPSTPLWVGVTTSLAGPIGQGFWNCGSTCNGPAPTSASATPINSDQTLTGWSICVVGTCASGGTPGGTNAPASYAQTINNTTPSLDGSSMKLTETTLATSTQTNILFPYKNATTCDSCRFFSMDVHVYPVNFQTTDNAEFDMFDFDATDNLSLTIGGQCNLGLGKWQIGNQTSGWSTTTATCALSNATWHEIKYVGHATLTTLYYDTITIDGVTQTIGMTLPTTPLPGGFTSAVGYQIQMDKGATTSAQTMTEYLDEASFVATAASSSGNGTYPCYYVSANYGTYTGMGTAMHSACGGGGVQAAQYVTLTSPTPSLVGGYLTVPGSAQSLQVGKTIQFYAVCQYSDGTSYLCFPGSDQYGNQMTSITSSNPGVAVVGSVGSANPALLSGIAPGSTVITGVLPGGIATQPYAESITVSATPLPPVSPKAMSR